MSNPAVEESQPISRHVLPNDLPNAIKRLGDEKFERLVDAALAECERRGKNIAAASEFSKKLTQAKDFSEFWQIQAEFMQGQWKAFSEQTKELGEIVTKDATGALKGIS